MFSLRLPPSLTSLPSLLSLSLSLDRFAAELAAEADVSADGASFLSSLYAGACRAAFRLQCSRAQLEAFVRPLSRAVTADMRDWARGARASYDEFAEDVLRLTVERPPASAGVLTPLQAEGAVDYALRAYFQNHALYKAVCARVPSLDLQQRAASGLAPPPAPPPLASALHVL